MITVIVAVENNRVSKFSEFETAEEANSHLSAHGGLLYEGNYSPLLHVDGGVVSLKPIEISEKERQAQIKGKIEEIERNEIMPRKTREIQIQVMEYFASTQGITKEQLYLVNPAYKGMVDVDTQIRALREQL